MSGANLMFDGIKLIVSGISYVSATLKGPSPSGHIAPFVGFMAASAGTRPLRSRRKRCTRLLQRTGPPPEGRDWRGRKLMEETMRVLTINELMRLTRIELCNLAQRITNELPQFAEGSPERANAMTTLRNIHYVLARRDFTP
jgi:hypothetical protein